MPAAGIKYVMFLDPETKLLTKSGIDPTRYSLTYKWLAKIISVMPATSTVSPEVLAKYEPVIGLEVHVQLLTATKAFCGCANRFGAAPNTNVCPVCLGLPGALPVLNAKAVEFATLASLAINCQIRERSIFARKNYFYPDLPKGYQISQFDKPLAEHGWIDVPDARTAAPKRIGITRLHMEEDAGKSLHDGFCRLCHAHLHRPEPLRHAAG